MRFRRDRAARAVDLPDTEVAEAETSDVGPGDAETSDVEPADAASSTGSDPDDADENDEHDETDAEIGDDEASSTSGADDEPEPTGRFAWLKPRKKQVDYGPDFAVRVATLPDLERFPEDGHVHPEIVRSWMALQQFGEAMLLVSWLDKTPAGYVMVSWTGDWDDEVRAAYPDVPALCNLWADERHAASDVEARLIEAAVTVCTRQGRRSLLATVEADNRKVRAELEELGFEPTDLTTSQTFVYRDAQGRRRRGRHENHVLLKKL